MTRWLILFLLYSLTAGGQVRDEIVKVNVSKVIVKAGRQSVINISVEVKDGYHIQANEVNDEYIIPTTIEIDGGSEFIIKSLNFPSVKKFKLEGTDVDLDVYDGLFEILAFFNSQKTLPKDLYQLNGALTYQACDSIRCLFPKTIKFLIEIEVQ
ncbi:MAG TPA: protein-disulfide reductase DsbD domain-containing protein [Cyclobacteriaceae bacterium]|nr:protein-disulfide reductase DsbD domain-containing protein [Cyclobacteriaceae bacterium]